MPDQRRRRRRPGQPGPDRRHPERRHRPAGSRRSQRQWQRLHLRRRPRQRQHRRPAAFRQHHLPLRRQPDPHPRPPHDEDGRPVAPRVDQRVLFRQQRPQRFHATSPAVHGAERCQPRPEPSSARPISCSGLPDDYGRGLQSGTWGQRSTVYGLYFQDDWRATNNLTLNLGLRWEYHSPWVEVENRQANFDEFTGQLELAAPLPATWSRLPGPAPLVESNTRPLPILQKGLPAARRLRLTPRIF